MDASVIFKCEYIQITKMGTDLFIESFRKGMPLDQLNQILNQHPEITITRFITIKNALTFAPRSPEKFGEIKERIFVEISSDELKAFITLSVSEDEFSGEKRVNLIKEILSNLNSTGVVFGLKHSVLLNELCNNRRILVAEGIPAVNGHDSVSKMYEIKEIKPIAKEDGKVDHYELNLINTASAGDWLGERIDPTPGSSGKSVKGNVLAPMPGKMYPIVYDRKSVREVYEGGKTVLYALCRGAVHFDGEAIGVSNHLEITQNINFKTGNIDFDGYLTVKGSVEDSFSVAADKDIEILGEYGVGSVKEIVSREGSVYIKGGIAGKNKAIVRSKKDIYTKFVSDAEIICDGSVHIGFYCLSSIIKAKEVILDSPKGQIMGGTIQADIKVVSSIIGSNSEKRTCICVEGFDRAVLKQQLEQAVERINDLRNDLIHVKQEISIYSYTGGLTKEQLAEYERIKDRFYEVRNNLKLLEDERKSITGYLKTHGEGEVAILKKAYPNTLLEIKKVIKEINDVVVGTSFYIQDGELKEI